MEQSRRLRAPEIPDDLIGSAGRVLKTREAAGYLGVCVETVYKLRRNGKLPSVNYGKGKNAPFGFLLSDLDQFILTCRIGRFVWDEDSPELPIKVVCRLLGLSLNGYRAAVGSGRLKDRTYASVIRYIEHRLGGTVRRDIRRHYEGELNRLNCKIHRLQIRLADLPARRKRKA